jgi:hypothetical protein
MEISSRMKIKQKNKNYFTLLQKITISGMQCNTPKVKISIQIVTKLKATRKLCKDAVYMHATIHSQMCMKPCAHMQMCAKIRTTLSRIDNKNYWHFC